MWLPFELLYSCGRLSCCIPVASLSCVVFLRPPWAALYSCGHLSCCIPVACLSGYVPVASLSCCICVEALSCCIPVTFQAVVFRLWPFELLYSCDCLSCCIPVAFWAVVFLLGRLNCHLVNIWAVIFLWSCKLWYSCGCFSCVGVPMAVEVLCCGRLNCCIPVSSFSSFLVCVCYALFVYRSTFNSG